MRLQQTAAQLAAAIPRAVVIGDGSVPISGLAYDSRRVEHGDLFAALRGADLDGHAFVEDAVRRGAAAVLVESRVPLAVPQIVVTDTREALALVAATLFGNPSNDLGVIGITGTDGKTTTSYLIDHLLRSSGLRTGLVGTIAIRIGDREELHAARQTTPESSDVQGFLRQMADIGTDWAVIEATSHGLAMHRLDHLRFQIGAITNITHEHLDFHGSLESYRRAKAILLERVAEASGTVVLNVDDEGARSIQSYAGGANVLRYSPSGAAPEADIVASSVSSDARGSTFQLATGGSVPIEVALPLIGDFNVANAVCAAGVALAAGVSLPCISAALATAPAVPGRMALVASGQPFSVVVDYAHTPDAMMKVLPLLRGLHPRGRLIVVFGSAGERDVEKRARQGVIAARYADVSVITSEDPRFEDAEAIIDQIAEGGLTAGAKRGVSLHCRVDRREAIELALSIAVPGDCVLLAGKGHESSIIWGRDKIPWDEAGVAREVLAGMGYEQP